jgi:hypothetical protein
MKWESILKRLTGDRFLVRRIERALKSLNYEKINHTNLQQRGRFFSLIYYLTLDELGDLLMSVIEETSERNPRILTPRGMNNPEIREAMERPSMEGFKHQLFNVINYYFSEQDMIDLVSKYPNDMVLAEYIYVDRETNAFKFIEGSPEMYAKIVEESEEHRRPIE